MADRVLGQGSNTLVLLTTNEALSRLHPAVVRPCRCLARVEFTRFPVAEALRWIDSTGTVGGRLDAEPTLAELLERRGDLGYIGGRPEGRSAGIGQYL